MPHHSSPKKMLRRDIKARARNKSQLSTLKTFIKKCKVEISAGTPSEESFRKAQSLTARAGRKGLIPQGRADRIISRMMTKKVEAQAS